jgi:hypothetical protein
MLEWFKKAGREPGMVAYYRNLVEAAGLKVPSPVRFLLPS